MVVALVVQPFSQRRQAFHRPSHMQFTMVMVVNSSRVLKTIVLFHFYLETINVFGRNNSHMSLSSLASVTESITQQLYVQESHMQVHTFIIC